MKSRILLLLLTLTAMLAVAVPAGAQSTDDDAPALQAVMFFSPTCPHCEMVINDHLPGIFNEYGGEPELRYDESLPPSDVAFYEMTNGTLEILLVDVSIDAGAEMYTADVARLEIPDGRMGVPRLDVADDFFVGSQEIPTELPLLIEDGIAAGGVAWPDVPGLEDALASIPGADVPVDPGNGSDTGDATGTLPSTNDQSVWDRISNDPVGNGLAIVVLVAMVASLFGIALLAGRGALLAGPSWLVPVLALVGIGVSIYLASVEASGAEAVCGPVGDCNAVQQSEYASVFGIPVGVLGVIGYLILLGGWAASRAAKGRIADWGSVVAAAIALGGILFSIYLTFLEPFVIGATCMWCLTSAVAITGLLWLTAGPGLDALGRLTGTGDTPPSKDRELTYG
ncbi:MAG: vitamin K epoxide reductase family protein [Actinomycetota bacterium]